MTNYLISDIIMPFKIKGLIIFLTFFPNLEKVEGAEWSFVTLCEAPSPSPEVQHNIGCHVIWVMGYFFILALFWVYIYRESRNLRTSASASYNLYL